MNTATNLIDAMRAFFAEQAATAAVGLAAVERLDDPAASAALEAINDECAAVTKAFTSESQGWADDLFGVLTDQIVGLDPLVDYVDREHFAEV